MKPDWKDIPDGLVELITACLLGTADDDQRQELDVWLTGDAANRLFYEYLKSTVMIDGLARRRSFDSAAALDAVRAKLARRRRTPLARRVLPYIAAASILVAAALGIYVFTGRDNALLSVAPARPSVQLTLPSGEVLELDRSGVVVADTVSGFRNEGEILSYKEGAHHKNMAKHSLYVPRGGHHRLILSDGTQVWLNSDTRLTFNDTFAGGTREVELSGEAYFDVAHNGQMPFVVKANGMDIRVLGTEFNISAYEGDSTATTTLVSGSVEAMFADADPIRMTPGHQVIYEVDKGRTTYREVNPFVHTAWHDGKVVFYHTRMSDVAEQLARWYDVEFRFRDDDLREVTIFAVLNRHEDIGQVLEAIRIEDGLDFRVKGRTITVVKP